MISSEKQTRVSLVAVPESMVSPLTGLYEVLNAFPLLGSFDDAVPRDSPFRVEVVSAKPGATVVANGLPMGVHRAVHEVERTDIVIVPSMMLKHGEWVPGQHPEVVRWLSAMHDRGALLCSACTGVLLLAETGLLNGHDATIHWAFAQTFRRNFPNVRLRLDEVLVATGDRSEFIMSGASTSWHDLVLYLITRHAGPTAAQAIARFMLLQRHIDGQAPYVTFTAPTDHGDAIVRQVQEWLSDHHPVASPVEEMVRRSTLPERTFKRRFTRATGYSPIAYVQHLRIEEAKNRLERTDASVDDISWAVGYEDPASFRHLFKRITRLTPRDYRRKFRTPDFPSARPQGSGNSPKSRGNSLIGG